MSTYIAPELTKVGTFQELTKSFGDSPYNDILGYPALIVIYP